ncbi:4-hydroxybenzoate 3-monooxygenase [Waterburya agarophytonicola K14]|uniref:4-hydroxybenzoate 3-monooxygenase n=1 Tax=Waterburya agarophytonicola KI4 TaxID=2874699 RepID=A0A964BRY4_9CYAN|nr:4-hydroxybenzoate 3-monooxygenase [Waterburya agarophytonicola]MCC0177682.1 4-hydroxybenzoate 3-monooxygenase [Waterburya agarophytonicola KI4]
MSINQIATKVCIIGAGPAGLLIANILRQNHIPCIVIEKYSQAEIYARSRAGLVDNQTVTILKEHGLSDRLFAEGIPHGKCEFRTPEKSFILDYARKCQGQTHYTYPQQEILVDLIEKFEQAAGEILFNTQGIKITNNSHGAWIKCQQNGKTLLIKCDFIAGCDGFHGVSRASIPETITKPYGKDFDYAWLAITAEAPPSTEHIIYGLHPNGFAGHMLRNEKISRYYLQIPLEDKVVDWSDSRIWSELHLRLAKDGWKLTEGKIIGKQILKMRSFATQTMQHCRLFLAGDSAHIMTPAGGKGMNLAIQDADVLGKSFVSYYRYHDNLPLKKYSQNRIPAIRQTQQFSESLLHMINVQDNTIEGKSQQRVQQFKRSQLMNSEIYALDFARKYVGYLPGDRSASKSITAKKTTQVIKLNPAELPPLRVG